MSYFSQMAGLTVQNFLSAGTGIVVAVALIRGIISRSGKSLGNFWQDMVRTVLYVLLPLSIIVALVLVSQGSIANFTSYLSVHGISGLHAGRSPWARSPRRRRSRSSAPTAAGSSTSTPRTRSRTPPGSPTSSRCWRCLLIPAALVFMYGKHGRQPPPGLRDLLDDDDHVPGRGGRRPTSPRPTARPRSTPPACTPPSFTGSTGGNLEGKEQRFGIAGSALFDVITTVTSCGAVNSAIESFTGIGGAVPFANLSASEVIFGGVGTGLYSILLYVLLAVFLGGLMVGRTPEYLGKKIEAREIKLVSLGILITPLAALFCDRLGSRLQRRARIDRYRDAGTGPQGFSETLYAYLSQANNNGSAFAGYTGFIQPNAGNLGSHGVTFADLLGGFDMLVRPLRAHPVRPRCRRLAGRQADQPGRPGHDAHG